jgi:hypothetical protein
VENVEIPKDRVLLTLRDRDDLMSSWSLSSALDFTVPAMPVTRLLLIIRRLGKASARFRFGPYTRQRGPGGDGRVCVDRMGAVVRSEL